MHPRRGPPDRLPVDRADHLITWAPTGDTVVCEDARGAQGGTGVGCTANPWGVYDTTEVEFLRLGITPGNVKLDGDLSDWDGQPYMARPPATL